MNMQGYQTPRTFPPFTENDVVMLSKRSYIVLFDSDRVRFVDTYQALLAKAPNFKLIKTHDYQGKSSNVYTAYILTNGGVSN